ncbi:MAG: tryptophan-rich sensory protein [archaeon]|nr:MAG: tryptophan-rich sensory protein [archaeon]
MAKLNVLTFVLAFVIIFIVAFLGSVFTSQGTSTQWYESIKPSITPPNFVFPIAWTILFILIALALYFAWINAKEKDKLKIGIVFGINFVLNVLWSYLYFGLRNVRGAFIEIIILWFSILAMILVVRKVDKKSAWMLVPYLVWVTFAAVLNYLSFA